LARNMSKVMYTEVVLKREERKFCASQDASASIREPGEPFLRARAETVYKFRTNSFA
jgi:hypothetical protein